MADDNQVTNRPKDLQFRIFRPDGRVNAGRIGNLHTGLQKARAFANTLDPDDLVGIAHSHQETYGASIVVWYRGEEPDYESEDFTSDISTTPGSGCAGTVLMFAVLSAAIVAGSIMLS